MSVAYFQGDSYTPQMGLRGLAMFGRTAGGVWLPALVDSSGTFMTGDLAGASVTVTPTLDTSQYANNDLIADNTAIANAVAANAAVANLKSISIMDGDDQKEPLSVVFLDSNVSLGSLNSAPNISDANVQAHVLGQVSFAAADYVDIGGASVASKTQIGLMLKAAAATRTLYFGIVNLTGTPTYTAGGLTLTFGFEWF